MKIRPSLFIHPVFLVFSLFCFVGFLLFPSALRADDLVIDHTNVTLTSASDTTFNYDDLVASGAATLTVNATGASNKISVEFENYDPQTSSTAPTTLWLLTNQSSYGDRTQIFFSESLPVAITPSGTPPVNWRPIVSPSIVMTNPLSVSYHLAAAYQDAETGELTPAIDVVKDIRLTDQFSIFRAEDTSGDNITLYGNKEVYVLDVVGRVRVGGGLESTPVLKVDSGLVLLNNNGGNRASEAIINFGDQTGYITGNTTRSFSFNGLQGSNGVVIRGPIRTQAGVPPEVILNSDNPFTGSLFVETGIVRVNGSISHADEVIVSSGATLGGTGSIHSAVTINGGFLSPGASVESLETGTVTLNDNSTFDYEVDSGVATSVGADLLKVDGNFNLNDTVALSLSNLSVGTFDEGTTFTLINYSGNWNSGLFTYDSVLLSNGDVFSFNGQDWRIDYDAVAGGLNFTGDYFSSGSSFVNITAVPEPSGIGLAVLGLGLCACFLRIVRRRIA